MVKEVKIILMGFLMALFLIVSNGAYILYQVEDPMNLMSGNSIKEKINGFYEVSSINHRAFILFQFLLLFVIVIFFFIIVRKFKSKTKLSKGDFIKDNNTKSGTDLDTLYEILKRKKEIDIDNIGKVFKVNSEVALEWSKILENGNLAMIDYPRFRKPVLKLLEENNGEKFVPKNDVENKKNIEPEGRKEEIKDVHHKDVVSAKKIIAPKDISKKEVGGNLKIEKRVEKKVRKMNKKVEKIKKIRRKSKKR